MPMPASWIDRIFDKLTMVYGHQFIGRWSGLDLAKVKSDWAHELDGMEAHPKAISYALQRLDPDSPPTVLQFRELCRRAPEPKPPALPAPEVNQAAAQEAIQRAVSQATQPKRDVLHRQREHMHLEIDGVQLNKAQREFWRIALRSEILSCYGIDTAQKFSLADLGAAINHRRSS
jgi:hypothetical protein